MTMAAPAVAPAAFRARSRFRFSLAQGLMLAGLFFLLFLTFVPIGYLAVLALKDNGQIYGVSGPCLTRIAGRISPWAGKSSPVRS